MFKTVRNILFFFICLLFIAISGVYLVFRTGLIRHFDFYQEPVSISGTGSMYPTFPKGTSKTSQEQAKETVGTPNMMPYPNGITIFDKKFFAYQIRHGDIVVFENEETKRTTQELYGEASGYIKRVIALPGDTIEIRDGLTILNGSPLNEPYIALAHSTFGGNFLSDCQVLKIPVDKLFVMGDNRKSSGDSRYDLGLISFEDINHVLPLTKQKGSLDKNWRDTSNDLSDVSKIKLDPQQYLNLLNQKREEANLKPLKYNPKLEKSAQLRAQNIIKFDDFSFEATKSGYTAKKAMDDANYSNIISGEVPLNGYYDAQELLDNYFEFASSKKFMLNKDYQDIGIAIVDGLINGCPTQVIVQHLGGYIPPNYKKEEILTWKDNLNNLKNVQSDWQSLKDSSKFYDDHKTDIDRINQIIDTRITNLTAIVNKMSQNIWLSKTENDYTYQDIKLFEEQQNIAQKLNNQQ